MADELRILDAARKRLEYAQQRSVDPFSSALKRTVLQVWDITHRQEACVATGSWWWQRFKSHVAVQPRITPAHVALWVATRGENNELTAPSARHAQKELFFFCVAALDGVANFAMAIATQHEGPGCAFTESGALLPPTMAPTMCDG